MNFEYAFPESALEALDANENNARWLAGGTDLIPGMKLGLAAPARLVSLKRVHELRGIVATERGVTIGALATLAEIAENETIRTRYRALAQACELSASPQIRNMGTIGGNLCQDSRCAYYRNGFKCFLRGGSECFMREGENREAAVIGYHDCVHVHPSDPANALVAFDALIVIRGRAGERTIPIGEFFRAPDSTDARMNVLEMGDMITAILLPHVPDNTHSMYVKAMDRAAWAFALASAAVRVELTDGKISNARVVLGGVAPIPWRELRIETALSGLAIDSESATQESNSVLEKAQPLAHNAYKLRLARAMVKRALRGCIV